MKKILIVILILAIGFWGYKTYLSQKENSEQRISSNYMETPESGVVFDQQQAYLVAYEKRQDGFWYLTFKNIQEDSNTANGNVTYRAANDLKVVNEHICASIDDQLVTESFDAHALKLTKRDFFYWNPTNTTTERFVNGSYFYAVNRGEVTTLEEVAYNCGE